MGLREGGVEQVYGLREGGVDLIKENAIKKLLETVMIKL